MFLRSFDDVYMNALSNLANECSSEDVLHYIHWQVRWLCKTCSVSAYQNGWNRTADKLPNEAGIVLCSDTYIPEDVEPNVYNIRHNYYTLVYSPEEGFYDINGYPYHPDYWMKIPAFFDGVNGGDIE